MIEPRQYQAEAIGSIFDYFGTRSGNPVIAMPTGTGKSIVIALFLWRVLNNWPDQRIIIATHVKELVEQNYKKMLEAWPEAPAGIYSAGLKKKQTHLPIIFGGIQSMAKSAKEFGWRNLLIVDEAHLISGKDDSNYGRFIKGLRANNPSLKVIGLSATPWRMGSGLISDGPIFTDICFDISSMESFNRLITEGYLCTLVPKRTQTELHVDDIAVRGDDYIQKDLQEAVDKNSITYAACKEMVEQGHDRISWLVFASGVKHADHIAGTLLSMGINAQSVHSKIEDGKRDRIIRDFKSGELRCIVNNNVLTTGFDHPGIDMIGMLRPTASTGLWVQMLGRGTRPSPETMKENCLVLDFAGNTRRLGPINDPVIPKKRGLRDGSVPVKICEACGTYNHARATICIGCGASFIMMPKIVTQADTQELIKINSEPITKTFDVLQVIYGRHQKHESLPILKVSYLCGLSMFPEWICLEHTGFAGKKARDWWRRRIDMEPPKSVDEALQYLSKLRVPRQIMVKVNQKYPEVVSTLF